MLKHPNANSLSKIENSAKLRKYLKIQESLEKQAPECLVQLLVQNLNVKSSSNFNKMSKSKFLKKLMKIAKNSPPKTFIPVILKEFKKNFHFIPGQRPILWKY